MENETLYKVTLEGISECSCKRSYLQGTKHRPQSMLKVVLSDNKYVTFDVGAELDRTGMFACSSEGANARFKVLREAEKAVKEAAALRYERLISLHPEVKGKIYPEQLEGYPSLGSSIEARKYTDNKTRHNDVFEVRVDLFNVSEFSKDIRKALLDECRRDINKRAWDTLESKAECPVQFYKVEKALVKYGELSTEVNFLFTLKE